MMLLVCWLAVLLLDSGEIRGVAGGDSETLPLTVAADTADNQTSRIPLVIYQTYEWKDRIPAKVEANMLKFAPQYKRSIYNDKESVSFIEAHFNRSVLRTYWDLKGAHRADLFRYAVLYINGGVYIDIKTEVPTLEKYDRSVVTSFSISQYGFSITDGVIGSPKGNPLFLHLIQDFVQSKKPIQVQDYQQSCKKMYECIADETSQDKLKGGLNVRRIDHGSDKDKLRELSELTTTPPLSGFSYYLFEEKRRPIEECYDGADRYKGCWFVYKDGERVIKTRYSDYPWHKVQMESRD